MLLLKNNISDTRNVVGFTYDPANSSPTLTATGTSEMMDLGIIFSKFKLVLLADNLTETVIATWANPTIPTGTDLTGASGQVMVKIPRIWYKEYYDGTGTLTGLDVADWAKPGLYLHEKFAYANKDYVYVGIYEAGDDGGTKLKSASGVAPLVNQTLATFRTRAFARGTGWYPYDFYTNHLLKILFYAYYKTWDSQSVLPGYTEASSYLDSYKRLTGRTNNLTTINGIVLVDLAGTDSDLTGIVASGKSIANRFLWIENIFGHIWKMIDGFAADGRTSSTNKAYVTADPSKFSSVDATVLANYTDLGILLPGATNEAYIQNLQKGLLPKTHGGASNTYITDYFWSYLDYATRNYLRIGRVGGLLNDGSVCGCSALHVYFGLGGGDSIVCSRLCAIK